jgi:hypothetical protein
LNFHHFFIKIFFKKNKKKISYRHSIIVFLFEKDCSSTHMQKNPCHTTGNLSLLFHKHSFTRERYVECIAIEMGNGSNPRVVSGAGGGPYARVRPCLPLGASVWSETEARCVAKEAGVLASIGRHCKRLWSMMSGSGGAAGSEQLRLPYPFSLLKYVECVNNQLSSNTTSHHDDTTTTEDWSKYFTVQECPPRLKPFYCTQQKICVANYFADCHLL